MLLRRSGLPDLLCLALFCGSVGGCSRSTTHEVSLVKSAQFGLFFGGQIQQRVEIPLVLDSTQGGHGIRLQFHRPLVSPVQVTWHLDRPTARSGPRGTGNAPRGVRTESVTLAAGSDRFEQLVNPQPGDPPGTYNIRILVGSELVLDRSFRLVQRRHDYEE